MTEMWYYTSEGKQMEPVSAAELKQLALSGLLKPTDMVWKEGMPKWIRASSAQGLFEDSHPAAASSPPVSGRTAPTLERTASGGGRETRREPEDEERPRREKRRNPERDYDEDDRPRRRRRSQDEGMSTGLKVGIILGASVLLIGIVVGGIVLLAHSGTNQKQAAVKPIAINPPIVNPPIVNPPPVNPGPLWNTSYTVTLFGNNKDVRPFTFKANTRYELTARGDQLNRDFDFAVLDNNNNDVKFTPNNGREAFITFNPALPGNYRVEVHNLSNLQNRITVTIREVGPEPAGLNFNNQPPVTNPIPIPPPPGRLSPPVTMGPITVGPGGFTHTSSITKLDARDMHRNGLCKLFTVNMTAGRTYVIRNESTAFDAYLILLDSNNNSLAQDDDSGGALNSQITFRPSATGVYRIVATSLGGINTGPFTLRITEK